MMKLTKEMKTMVEKFNVMKEYYEMEIKVSFINDMFEEEHYVELELFQEEERLDNYTILLDGIKSAAKNYNLAKDIQEKLQSLNLNVTYKKEIYR